MKNDSDSRMKDLVTTVIGSCEMLLEGSYGRLTLEQRRVLLEAIEAGTDMIQLVQHKKADARLRKLP